MADALDLDALEAAADAGLRDAKAFGSPTQKHQCEVLLALIARCRAAESRLETRTGLVAEGRRWLVDLERDRIIRGFAPDSGVSNMLRCILDALCAAEQRAADAEGQVRRAKALRRESVVYGFPPWAHEIVRASELDAALAPRAEATPEREVAGEPYHNRPGTTGQVRVPQSGDTQGTKENPPVFNEGAHSEAEAKHDEADGPHHSHRD